MWLVEAALLGGSSAALKTHLSTVNATMYQTLRKLQRQRKEVLVCYELLCDVGLTPFCIQTRQGITQGTTSIAVSFT